MARFDEKCDRGVLHEIILPPSWLLRLSNTRKRRKQLLNCEKLTNTSSVLSQNTQQFSQSYNSSSVVNEETKTKKKVNFFWEIFVIFESLFYF